MESSGTNRYRHLRNYKCSDTKRSYYLFVRSEYEETYSQLLRVSAEAFDTFFDYHLEVATCSIDHTQYIQTALKKQWPQVHVVSCAIHML
ncbi:hypothetical protein H257_03378 [Aphanomyces astaci]|uniref:MULE transposase domain-containing protein n=1 Tax=Aphanomyces astaci TaxID=112090 RepID=W4GYC6_APHAT|nr:hypothetical protein H257_03378 [Aphanomyces astaci]ETV84019.1 hypothetical protein H257_03378 [Aphanomyces astaci]|eukprot:XP_009825711.1 hypothetical protein H257_03378 [Aphanomyces astaci]